MSRMTNLPLHDSYSLLAIYLSPYVNDVTDDELRKAARANKIDWTLLLLQANMHFCTPLWYVRLRQKELLADLPSLLQRYLYQLHQANVERTEAFHQAIKELLQLLHEQGVPAILLKGAASLCDDLYDDPGARMMGDIDLLVDIKNAENVQKLLYGRGYIPLHQERYDDYSPSYQPQHLPRILKPGTPVALEIHFHVERGQAGRVLSNDLAWGCCEEADFHGLKTKILSPTVRILHNTVHALVSQREFIRSNISLLQLIEFVTLAHKYQDSIQWDVWYDAGKRRGLARHFIAYLFLAHRLAGLPIPSCIPLNKIASLDVSRLIAGGRNLIPNNGMKTSFFERVERKIIRYLIRSYYLTAVPSWLWFNIGYAEGIFKIPARLSYMNKYLTICVRNHLSPKNLNKTELLDSKD